MQQCVSLVCVCVCVVFVCSIQPMFFVILRALPDVCQHDGYVAKRAVHTMRYHRPIFCGVGALMFFGTRYRANLKYFLN